MASPGRRALVHGRDNERCVSCATAGGNLHHRKLRSQGGRNISTNLITLCGSGTTGCHGHWHHHREQARALGYILDPGADPAKVPYYSLPWQSWVLPDDDGMVKLIEAPPGNDARNYTPGEEPDE